MVSKSMKENITQKVEVSFFGFSLFLLFLWYSISEHWEMYYACEKFDKCAAIIKHMSDIIIKENNNEGG